MQTPIWPPVRLAVPAAIPERVPVAILAVIQPGAVALVDTETLVTADVIRDAAVASDHWAAILDNS